MDTPKKVKWAKDKHGELYILRTIEGAPYLVNARTALNKKAYAKLEGQANASARMQGEAVL